MFSPQYSGLKTLAENGYLRKLEDNEQIPIPTSLQLRCNSLLGYIHQPNRIICDDIEDDNQNGKEQLCLCVKNLLTLKRKKHLINFGINYPDASIGVSCQI